MTAGVVAVSPQNWRRLAYTGCRVLIGTPGLYRPCGLPGNPCSSHRVYEGTLPYRPQDLRTRRGEWGVSPARPVAVPVRGSAAARTRASAR